MPQKHHLWPFMLIGLAISGCQTAPTGAANDFVTAANALAQAESAYFDQIQAASDDSHVLIASAVYVRHVGPFSSIAGELTKRDDFSKAKPNLPPEFPETRGWPPISVKTVGM
jgi:hypothetical protein